MDLNKEEKADEKEEVEKIKKNGFSMIGKRVNRVLKVGGFLELLRPANSNVEAQDLENSFLDGVVTDVEPILFVG